MRIYDFKESKEIHLPRHPDLPSPVNIGKKYPEDMANPSATFRPKRKIRKRKK